MAGPRRRARRGGPGGHRVSEFSYSRYARTAECWPVSGVRSGPGGSVAQRRTHRGPLPRKHWPRDGDGGVHANSPGMEAGGRVSGGGSDARMPGARYGGTAGMDHGLRGPAVTAPSIDFSFSHAWTVEILARRPLILPPRHYVYPRDAEEVERGALEVLITPGESKAMGGTGADPGSRGQPFLATCALGFRDPIVPTGVWSTP